MGGELGGERRVGWDRKGGRVGLGMGNRGRQGRDRQERKGRAGGEGGKRGIIAAPRIPTCRRLWQHPSVRHFCFSTAEARLFACS
jgi:hypothetical protein